MRPWYSTSWCPQPRLDIDFGGKTEAFYFAYGDDDVVLIIDAEPAGRGGALVGGQSERRGRTQDDAFAGACRDGPGPRSVCRNTDRPGLSFAQVALILSPEG